jgi:hypothetical protein
MKILVVVTETAASRDATAFVADRSPSEVLVVAPVQQRVDVLVEALAAHGIEATGCAADPDPLLAVEDALSFFEADEIVVSADAEDESVERIRDRVELPVHHVLELHRQLSGTGRTV